MTLIYKKQKPILHAACDKCGVFVNKHDLKCQKCGEKL